MKTNIAVFFGCRSVEHEVSIISAVQAMRSIDREKYDVTPVYVQKNGEMVTGSNLFEIENYKDLPTLLKSVHPVTLIKSGKDVVLRFLDNKMFKKNDDIKIDLAFPVVHGTNCEDGTMSGLFEFLGLPYISCDILSAACGMDKKVFKDVLKANGLPVLDCYKFRAREYGADKDAVIEKIENEIGYPVIVKPVNLGSSVGISKADNRTELFEALDLAVSFAENILAEKAVLNLREINCSVLGDADLCEASVCEEPFMTDKILSYADKYTSNSKSSGSKGMASLSRKVPADITEEKSNEIRDLSCRVFKAIGASGVVRIDYLMNDETKEVFVNEINTIPGSLAFYLWEATGLKYKDLIDRLVEIAFRKQRTRDNLTFSIDTDILSGASFGSKGAKGGKL